MNRASKLSLISLLTWAGDNDARWLVERYMDPSSIEMWRKLKSEYKNFEIEESQIFKRLVVETSHLTDIELSLYLEELVSLAPF